MDGLGQVGRLEVGVVQANGAVDVRERRRLIDVNQREQPVTLHGEVVVGGAIALQALEGARNDVECVRERKQLLEQGTTAVVELIALPGEARRWRAGARLRRGRSASDSRTRATGGAELRRRRLGRSLLRASARQSGGREGTAPYCRRAARDRWRAMRLRQRCASRRGYAGRRAGLAARRLIWPSMAPLRVMSLLRRPRVWRSRSSTSSAGTWWRRAGGRAADRRHGSAAWSR